MIVAAPRYEAFVLPAWLAWRRAGKRCALLTLVATTGGSPRPIGSQMAVNEDGESVGFISGGCIERALVLDALVAMTAGRNHIERYGDGSRFSDLRLPCGSGIDIHFDVTLDEAVVASVVGTRASRCEAVLDLDLGERVFRCAYAPAVRLVLVGQGPIMAFTARFAATLDMEVVAFTPDDDARDDLSELGVRVHPLAAPEAFDAGVLDRASAMVVLFHDHDYEPEVLKKALASDAFYIGALGSRRAQTLRLERLRAMGVDDGGRIHGPVGLDIGSANPPEIALSILAEIVACQRTSR